MIQKLINLILLLDMVLQFNLITLLSDYDTIKQRNIISLWCPKLVTGLLVTVALCLLSVIPLISVFTIKFFRFNIKF